MAATLRQALRRWLEPSQPSSPAPVTDPPPRAPMGPPPQSVAIGQAAPPRYPRSPATAGATEPWALICEQVALRVLAATYQMGSEVETAESDEQDPGRLEQLYRIDHAVTRIRRQAEILQVLTGRPVEDARRQITTLLDVVRAGSSATEYFQRIHIGHTADLAIVEFAADDLIRVLTELLDNATRLSPPAATVTVSAHLTEAGSVLIRVEDSGVGIPPDQLNNLNRLLAGDRVPLSGPAGELQLGLHVVARLAAAHRLGVTLTARPVGGVTATVLVPAPLICEVPPPIGAATTRSRRPGSHRAAGSAGGAPYALPGAGPVDDWSPPEPPPEEDTEYTEKGLPRRVTNSVRGTLPGAIPGSPLVPDPPATRPGNGRYPAPAGTGPARSPNAALWPRSDLAPPVEPLPDNGLPRSSTAGGGWSGDPGITSFGIPSPRRPVDGLADAGLPGDGAAGEMAAVDGSPAEVSRADIDWIDRVSGLTEPRADGARRAWHDEVAGFAAGFAAAADLPEQPWPGAGALPGAALAGDPGPDVGALPPGGTTAAAAQEPRQPDAGSPSGPAVEPVGGPLPTRPVPAKPARPVIEEFEEEPK